MFKTFIILKQIHIQTSAIKRKYPTLIVRIFLFHRAHIQNRDMFMFKHFAFTSETFWGFYSMEHIPRSSEGRVALLSVKTQGRANIFWKKIPKIPSPPPPRKNVPSLSVFSFQFWRNNCEVEKSFASAPWTLPFICLGVLCNLPSPWKENGLCTLFSKNTSPVEINTFIVDL